MAVDATLAEARRQEPGSPVPPSPAGDAPAPAPLAEVDADSAAGGARGGVARRRRASDAGGADPARAGEAQGSRLTILTRQSPRGVPVTLGLIAANVAVFGAMLAFGAGLWHAPNEVQLTWGANFGPATKDGQWWRLATAMFLHFGVMHLGMNMWALWDCGRLVERLYGSRRFLAIYLGSGLAGNLVSLIAQGDRAISGGASGAIFGVFGALLLCLARERRQIDRTEFRWLFWGGSAFAAATLALGFVVSGIDNAAHLGGLAAGGLLGVVFGHALKGGRVFSPRQRALAAASIAIAALLMAVNMPAPRYRIGEEQQARTAIRHFLDDERRIDERWRAIVDAGREGGASFDELAGRIDADVSRQYQDSFEALASIAVSPAAPSAASLDVLRRYAQTRGTAARDLAEALRAKDRAAIERALAAMQRAPQPANPASSAR